MKIVFNSLIGVLLFSSSAYAQNYSLFHERPEKRIAMAEELGQKALAERREATLWAKANNKPMRVDDGTMVMELMAIRDGQPLYYITHNNNAAISTAASKVRQTAPFNLDGDGVSVGVWDAGVVRTSHQEFDNGRATVKDGYATTHYHATHVAGTIGAKGVQSNAKGMAPKANIHSYYWGNDIAEITSAAATAPGQTGNKIYLSNHSYGQGVGWTQGIWYDNREEFGQYNSDASTIDQIAFNAQYYLSFWSAGNDLNDNGSGSPVGDGDYKNGYDLISHDAIAKNVMTVGAVNDAVSGGSRYAPNGTLTGFSSTGPADDGRIKPDIVANGAGLYSTYDTSDTAYSSLSGTSMSSPNACGSAALLVEYYKELFPPNGAMWASTLKGLIIHTATDRGRPGPDYQYGWGLMDTLKAAQLLEDYADGALLRLTEETLSSSSNPSDSYVVAVGGNEDVRVTICWTDPPGTGQTGDDVTTPALVNDLDLRITGPGGTYYPYKLDVVNPSHNATTGDNDVDNVEQILIPSPLPGNYTITIDYEGSLSGGTQRYSMLIDGISSDSDGDLIPDFWEVQYFSSTTGAVATADLDGDGSDNLSEYVAGTLPNDAASVFQITAYEGPKTGGDPVVVNWSTVPGRVYSVGYTPNLVFIDMESIPGATDLPYTQTSYTDTVYRAGSSHFYGVQVELE